MTERDDARRLTAGAGLADLLPDHFARGRQFAGLAGIGGTVAIQVAAHHGAIEVDDLRRFEALGVYGALWSLTIWVVPWERFGEAWIAFISLASTLLILATVWLSAAVAPVLGARIVPRVSTGIATSPADGTTADASISRAERRLYAAKNRHAVAPRSPDLPVDDSSCRHQHGAIPTEAPVAAESLT